MLCGSKHLAQASFTELPLLIGLFMVKKSADQIFWSKFFTIIMH
jgi:hypothetical protein